jgi:hypothetical protein
LDLFVHEAVNDTYATENAEGNCDFFITRGELHSIDFVAQLSNADNLIIVLNWNAQNVSEMTAI